MPDVIFVLSKGRSTVVSGEDACLSETPWHAHLARPGRWYARRKSGESQQSGMLLHREIAKRMGLAIDGAMVDHIDGDSLNNRRSNLRVATRSQNAHNSAKRRTNKSGHKGVHWSAGNRRWYVSIRLHGKSRHIGGFHQIEDAVAAYAAAAKELHGEFARTA